MFLPTLERPMAKKMGRPRSARIDATCKIDVGVLSKAKFVAKYDNIYLAEYVTEILRPVVERRMQQIAAEMTKRPPGK